ncbi:uncharacterized protein LY79DRAFT_558807, partial [Colletotrichum navitas]
SSPRHAVVFHRARSTMSPSKAYICQEVQDIPGVLRGFGLLAKGPGKGPCDTRHTLTGAIPFQMASRGPDAMLSPRFWQRCSVAAKTLQRALKRSESLMGGGKTHICFSGCRCKLLRAQRKESSNNGMVFGDRQSLRGAPYDQTTTYLIAGV